MGPGNRTDRQAKSGTVLTDIRTRSHTGERFDGNWTDVDVFVSAIEERIQSLEQ